jgi:hypothetical protein
VAILFSSLVGFLLGLTCLRLRGEYLAIATVAFGEIVQVILTQWEEVSGGPEGFLKIPKAHIGSFLFDTPIRYYYLTLVITLFIMVLTRNLTSSKLGRSFRSVKDDPLAGAHGVGPRVVQAVEADVGIDADPDQALAHRVPDATVHVRPDVKSAKIEVNRFDGEIVEDARHVLSKAHASPPQSSVRE